MQTPQRLTLDGFSCELQYFLRKYGGDPNLRFRTAFVSVHDDRFGRQCSGRGRVWRIAIPYIEGSEPMPDEHGCIHVDEHLLDVGIRLEITRGAPHPPRAILRLTQHEHSALLGVLIEYMRQPDSTQEWIDVLTDHTVTIGDLLALVSLPEVER